jgi:hypothetical protein
MNNFLLFVPYIFGVNVCSFGDSNFILFVQCWNMIKKKTIIYYYYLLTWANYHNNYNRLFDVFSLNEHDKKKNWTFEVYLWKIYVVYK